MPPRLAAVSESVAAPFVLSNAPRPAPAVQAQLDRFGVPRDAYDSILTSGDLTRKLISEKRDQRLFHLGPERDKPIFEGLDLRFSTPEEADLVVCSGSTTTRSIPLPTIRTSSSRWLGGVFR